MKLFSEELKVINIGLESFRETLKKNDVKSAHVKFRPPLHVKPQFLLKIREMVSKTEKANKKALDIIMKARPVLTDMDKAINVIPGMKKNLILHAGPPVVWDKMCGPMRGAVIGALILEGFARNEKEASGLACSGKIEFAPCHEHNAVGPMAGIISASMPVFIVKNETSGNFVYATQNEGLGKVLRYGAFSGEVIERLKWMENVLYPVLRKAIEFSGGIDLKSIIAQALHMGDEVHNRNRAATSLFYRAVAPAIVRTAQDSGTAASVLEFINKNDHFFLNLSMALSKASLEPVGNIKNSSIVTVMARNGTEFGIKVSGTGSKWFTGPAPVPDALFFAGFSKEDANPDIGDSAITETNGLGGFAIASSPAIVQFVGGKASDALEYTLKMYEITAGENNAYQIPSLDFRGVPAGIDLIKVVEKGILPFIDTGVAHKKPGIGQVGAGVVSAPSEPFVKAFESLVKILC
ncbi:MAG: DUF1116 domain-containing protein [Elusimicrobia bacterium]|nr:DUF1116 domain-containing protein [Elusimicrobiota bacterium]